MVKRRIPRVLAWLEAALAWGGHAFVDRWGRLERSYRRPYARIALRLRFAFYPLLALAALSWLAWDWQHDRNLASAENAIFDQVIKLRPWEPTPSGRVVVVEIDDCSIARIGPWPWSRQQHADLLDALDRAGVRAVGYDVMFLEPSNDDPIGDSTLEAMAEGGNGRFLFGSSRVHSSLDAQAGAIPVSQVPGAFPLVAQPAHPGPRVAVLLPYGPAMARNSALLDVTRDADGVLRDVPLRTTIGDWALPSMSLRLAAIASGKPLASFPASVRVNWRTRTKLPTVSAADLIDGKSVCGDRTEAGNDASGLPLAMAASRNDIDGNAQSSIVVRSGASRSTPSASRATSSRALLRAIAGPYGSSTATRGPGRAGCATSGNAPGTCDAGIAPACASRLECTREEPHRKRPLPPSAIASKVLSPTGSSFDGSRKITS